jgi:predicted molibdopterin-dependent oxidoreductase YjgC
VEVFEKTPIIYVKIIFLPKFKGRRPVHRIESRLSVRVEEKWQREDYVFPGNLVRHGKGAKADG